MIEGGCTCGRTRYALSAAPFAVHCCHCRSCQRETGASFALNGLVESEFLALLHGEVDMVETPSDSGKGQTIARCPHCRTAVWSHYGGMGTKAAFVRIGTLDNAGDFAPDVHIFTRSRQPWLEPGGSARNFAVFYRRTDYEALFGPDRARRYNRLRDAV